MKERKKVDKATKKKILTLFMLVFPTIIITAIPSGNWTWMTIKILLAIYQIVIIKNFIDEFYGE